MVKIFFTILQQCTHIGILYFIGPTNFFNKIEDLISKRVFMFVHLKCVVVYQLSERAEQYKKNLHITQKKVPLLQVNVYA